MNAGWVGVALLALTMRADASRLFMNEDFWHFWVTDAGVPADMERDGLSPMKPGIDSTRKGLESYIDEIARGKVTHFLMNVNGQRAGFLSKVLEPVWASLAEPDRDHAKWVMTLKRLADEGIDPYRVWIDRCREKGVSPWVSVRMNDLHRTGDLRCPNVSTLWRQRPELQLNPKSPWDNGFDYTKPEIRTRMLGFIREVLERYDVDGLELDLLRFNRYLPIGRETEFAPLFTAFIRDVSRSVNDFAAKRGHGITLSVRVLPYPRDSQERGLQVDVWAKEGLVGMVVPCNMWANIRFDISAADWREWIGTRADVVPGADSGFVEGGRRRLATLGEYRKWAAAMRRNGASDLYLFNLFMHPQDGEVWNGVLSEGLEDDVVIENARFRLVAGTDARVRSLVLKSTGEECVRGDAEGIPLFSVTQDRPFNNEVKLIHPNKRTTYPANALRREGDRLVVGFSIAPYEALVDLKVTDSYVEFRLSDFRVDKEDYDYLKMDMPPVASFRVLQLPVVNRKNFGDWLNASWDEKSAIGVVGTSPYPDIDHEERNGFRVLTADLVRGQRLKGASAAIIAANGREDFLDCMDALEEDFNLPRGVKSRRSDCINDFIYHVSGEASPRNIDKHIAWAKKGGFKYMTFGTETFTSNIWSWALYGDYDWNDQYPNGAEDLKGVLAKVKAAGIHPGLHFLHTHIGMKSRYVTPVADPRLNKTRRFTLAQPLDSSTNETEIAVFEPTSEVTMFPAHRVLQFGGELVSYESYTKEPPYRFRGVRRGAWNTTVTAHPRGEVGGVLDISEYGVPSSCYIDQNTDLQDEVSAKIAAIYDCGFEYAYFDGSEGVHPPCGFHVSNAQYRQWKFFRRKPIFSEGAAKTHFDWHILSGANAFDCFPPEDFKSKTVQFPVAQAPISWQDMTRVNFGWWKFFPAGKTDSWGMLTSGTKPDQWQFACSQCLAWDCATTVTICLEDIEADQENAEACFEVMRLWGEARNRRLLSKTQKELLKDTSKEYHLSIVDGKAVLRQVKK